ncbi:MAG: hypothetical protein JO322_14975 [Candidatus Eremiobacteraeota bacterium]|nr:hypothetical protein [Candidatus Eremiobacteraeota bacterium]
MKRARAVVVATLIAAAALATAAKADVTRGTWNIATERGTVQLELRWRSPDGRENNDHSSSIDAQTLGISNALASPGQHTTFGLHREAGDYAFDGWLGNGEGAGSYTFTPNGAFFATLRSRGYDVQTIDYQMAFANLDITSRYVDEIESLGYKSDVNQLVAMKALGVTAQYVHDLEAAGVNDITQSQVVPMRALRVDRAYVDEIAQAGFPHLSASQYVTLKAMRIDGAYIRYLRSHGFKNLTVNQVVTMKAERI